MAIYGAAGLATVAIGYLAGSALGGGGDSTPEASGPQPIETRSVAARVPTLGEVKDVPALDVPEPAVEQSAEPATTYESGATPEYTPEYDEPEPAPEVQETPSPEPEPSPSPEVTVAPNG